MLTRGDGGGPVQPTEFRPGEAELHYEWHGKAMGFADTAEYVDFAKWLLNQPTEGNIVGLTRVRGGSGGREAGDSVRYDVTNEWVAVMSRNGTIKTFFEPDAVVFYYEDGFERYGSHFMAPTCCRPRRNRDGPSAD